MTQIMTGSERRQHTRVPVDWPVKILQKGCGIVLGRVTDLSLGGCYFTTAQRFARASQAMMEIGAPDEGVFRKLLVEAEILHERPADGGYGHGASFKRIRDEDLWWIVAFIAQAKLRAM